MAGNNVMLDFDEWDQHAQWWDQEAPRVRERLSVDPGTAASVGQRFGDIGWEVREALNETLQARSDGVGRWGSIARVWRAVFGLASPPTSRPKTTPSKFCRRN